MSARRIVALLALAFGRAALAHHGAATVSSLGAEGPGAALDTTSPLPLGQGIAFALAKSEYARFQRMDGFTDQKRYSSFNTLALGYGLTPWLSAFVFQPWNVKSQDGAGTNAGLGDTSVMLALAFKWDEGLRLVPEKESLDDLADWHFGAWVATTLPTGPTRHRDAAGAYFAPDAQTGFRGPSPSAGLSVLKQLSGDLTFLGALELQRFYDQGYPEAGYRYQFGDEARASGAVAWRLWAEGARRVDVVPELLLLELQRDRRDGVSLRGSGGTILYGQLGARATLGSISVGAGAKRAVARRLNEGAEQQGSEGLESFRAELLFGYAIRP